MHASQRASDEQIRATFAQTQSIRATMREHHVSHATVSTALGKIRKAEEFKNGAAAIEPPRLEQPVHAWDLERIRASRDEQLAGRFKSPVRLAEAMRTDWALFNAYHTRLAPIRSLAVCVNPRSGTRGEAVANRARESVIVSRAVLTGIAGTLVNHGVSVGYIKRKPADDGTRVDFELSEWPLEHVRYNPATETLQTHARWGGEQIDILHGDGTWIVFRKFGVKPWTDDACILPSALLWAAHANGIRDWASTSASHALANKLIGELPAGVSMQNADGTLTHEASAFLNMLAQLASGRSPAGIRPSGGKTDFLSNTSTAWQIFDTFSQATEKAAARIYTGTDAIMGSVGGAPGVDVSQLFGVLTTRVQSDVEALEQGLNTGLYAPWCAVNEGDSRYAPTFMFELPDPDAAQEREQQSERWNKFNKIIKDARDAGCTPTPAFVAAVARDLKIDADELPQVVAPTTPPAQTTPSLSVGARVKVVPGKEHMPEHAGVPGTVKIAQNGSFGILFDGTTQVHKWYTADELQPVAA